MGDVGYATSGIGFPDAEQGGKEGIPFFKVSDMNLPENSRELVTSNNYVTESQIAANGWHPIANLPAIFFAKVGAAVYLNRKRLVDTPFLLDNNTMAFSLDTEKISSSFAQSLFEGIDLTALTQVGALPSLNAADIESLETLMPLDMGEQVKIGRYFANLDSLITLHQRKEFVLFFQERETTLVRLASGIEECAQEGFMFYDKESDFEEALIAVLKRHGWNDGVLEHPTEQDLVDNWAGILFDNNKGIDRLNGQRLTKGEMAQILEQIETLRTPLALNSFINGKTVSIKRDNRKDELHFGREISLKIYDRQEIAAGQSRYQIVRQPVYPARNKMLNDRRGDVCLLINGMPVIHIELKKSGIPVSQATNQIAKYAHEGVFTGLFRLVQVFVAMNPDDAMYFANPGENGFNKDFFFHWADYNNEPIAANKHIGQDEWKLSLIHI